MYATLDSPSSLGLRTGAARKLAIPSRFDVRTTSRDEVELVCYCIGDVRQDRDWPTGGEYKCIVRAEKIVLTE